MCLTILGCVKESSLNVDILSQEKNPLYLCVTIPKAEREQKWLHNACGFNPQSGRNQRWLCHPCRLGERAKWGGKKKWRHNPSHLPKQRGIKSGYINHADSRSPKHEGIGSG